MTKCFRFNEYDYVPKNFSERTFNVGSKVSRNWAHLLINVIRQGIRSGNVTPENKVEIITFNYDTILEHILEEQFSNSERMIGTKYTDFIEILHVHGRFGAIGEKAPSPQKRCVDWASGIHVINEDEVPPEVQAARKTAMEWVSESKEVYCCGFAFAWPNLRMLGLDKALKTHSRQLIVHNYDGNVGLARTVKRLEIGKVSSEINDASADKPMPLTDWIRTGYLGEMPG